MERASNQKQRDMETMAARPRAEKKRRFFREAPEKTETLEDKILRLHKEGHYQDSEREWFFSIPEEHRTDPFDLSPSGDVYWADRRNVEQLERPGKDVRAGKCFRPEENGTFEKWLESFAREE